MIQRMKKVTVLVSEKEREKFISRLREAGVLHVKPVNPPASHEINFVEDRISKIEKMLAELRPYVLSGRTEGQKGRLVCDERDIVMIADKVSEATREIRECRENIRAHKRQQDWFGLWGAFDPADLDLLKEKGANISFYRLNKHQFKELDKGLSCHVVKKEQGYVYLAHLTLHSDEKLPYEEVPPPSKSPDELEEDIEALEEIIKGTEEFLAEKALMAESVRKCGERLKKEHEFLSVKFGMQEEGRFSYIQGFCPVKRMEKITGMVKQQGLGYLVEEPDSPEETPTLVTNPKWIDIIKPVFQFMNTVPGYEEFDISFVFLIFFSVFFAMLIGDAGYGTLFLIVTFLARMKFRKLPPQPFFLMYVLSFSTIVWGAITGTWFGSETIARLPFFSGMTIGKISSFGPDNQNVIIYISFVLGVVHLTIAHLMRAVRMMNSLVALSQLGWVAIVWSMFFGAGTLVINRPFPPFTLYLLGAGVLLVMLFSQEPGKGWLKRTLGNLANLPLSVIGSFSDVVSYLRLFAVGYASVVLAQTFNGMALQSGISGPVAGLGAALTLFFGHALNITLGFMAVIVHGIRLNMLEFSGHLGMSWSGKQYEPFGEH